MCAGGGVGGEGVGLCLTWQAVNSTNPSHRADPKARHHAAAPNIVLAEVMGPWGPVLGGDFLLWQRPTVPRGPTLRLGEATRAHAVPEERRYEAIDHIGAHHLERIAPVGSGGGQVGMVLLLGGQHQASCALGFG